MAEHLTSLAIGVALAAACGFRVFLPLAALGAAARCGWMELADGWGWLASTPALVALGTATLLELLAYTIPWVDNLLDFLATPAAVVAGVLATASQLGAMDPLLGWSLAIVAGGGVAGVIQTLTGVVRQLSALFTGGLGNPLVAALEAIAAALLSLLAFLVPLLAASLALVLVALAIVRLRRRGSRPAPA